MCFIMAQGGVKFKARGNSIKDMSAKKEERDICYPGCLVITTNKQINQKVIDLPNVSHSQEYPALDTGSHGRHKIGGDFF